MHRLTHALALSCAGAVGLVLPTLLVGADAPATLVVATLAAAVAAMVCVVGRPVLAPAWATVHVEDRTHAPRRGPGRVTDPTHHPIRRRAPGQA
jgi:hypothetical protein